LVTQAISDYFDKTLIFFIKFVDEPPLPVTMTLAR
jgi:hypothetical protein